MWRTLQPRIYHVTRLATPVFTAFFFTCGYHSVAQATTGTQHQPRILPGDTLLHSASSLQKISAAFRNGQQTTVRDTQRLLDVANSAWPFGHIGVEFNGTRAGQSVYSKKCSPVADPKRGDILSNLGQHIYADALAYRITGDASYAEQAADTLNTLALSHGFSRVNGIPDFGGANQCALEISWLAPLAVEAALLIHDYSHWHSEQRERLQLWFAQEVYPLVSTIARTRKNNWGAAAALAAYSVAFYLADAGIELTEKKPATANITAAEALTQSLAAAFDIVGTHWKGDTKCDVWGIQPHGGIPDELRRGKSGCGARYLSQDDAAKAYQMLHVSHLIFLAEVQRVRGNTDLFDYRLSNGMPALLQAILFVIDNRHGVSYHWALYELGAVRLAYHYYRHPALCRELKRSTKFVEGRHLPYTRLTHPDSCTPL